MPRSRYAERFNSGIDLLKQIRDDQIGRLRSLQQANHRQKQIEDWTDLAKSEAGIKDRYRGRYLFELIQNANDAIVDQVEVKGHTQFANHHLVRLELTEKSLLVANFGQPFGEQNVRALCRLHKTTKSASKQIGHKGIGFKSVLEISSRPEVYSVGEAVSYAFGFDGDQFRTDVAEVMGREWDPDVVLPILRTPYFRNINQLPKHDRERMEALFDEDYVTVVRLPWDDGEQAKAVERRLREDIQPTLLLFMPAISQIDVIFPDGKEFSYWRDERDLEDQRAKQVILYRTEGSQVLEDSRWLVLGPIERHLNDSSLVKDLGEAWQEVHALTFSLAFPLERLTGGLALGETSQPFYVYFPTQEYSGLRFAAQADFHVRDDRKHLDPIPLNSWLVEEIALYLADEGVAVLKHHWPDSPQLVELLAPVSYPESAFSRLFTQRYLAYMRDAKFVPIDGGQYKAPQDCRFPPPEADQRGFRKLFPAARLRGNEHWAYPISEVVSAEYARNPKFLLKPELGGRDIGEPEVIECLRNSGMPPIEGAADLIDFLADWWGNLLKHRRAEFQSALGTLQIFPTGNGWQFPATSSESGIVFQANLRPDVEDMVTPPGFDFSVIIRSAYPTENATYSNQFQLFRALGAREYQSRALIQSAILPVLTNPDRLCSLAATYPTSVYDGLRLLKKYQADDGTTSGFSDRLPKVLLPAIGGTEGKLREWKPAGECYLGPGWPGGEALHTLYAGYADCYFVDELSQLTLSEGENIEDWLEFLRWLGVLFRPKLIEAQALINHTSKDPFEVQDSLLWQEYLQIVGDRFRCPNVNKPWHSFSRSIGRTRTLHHFADLVNTGDQQKLLALFGILARNWSEDFKDQKYTWLSCAHTSTGCPAEQIEDYVLFQLRNASWLPARVSDRVVGPLAPRQIWRLGETEPAEARRLVPSLPPELNLLAYQEFISDLGFVSSGSAQIEDFVRLLQLMPQQLPLDAQLVDDEQRTQWQRSVRAVFNWICDRLQTGLVSRQHEPPARPPTLEVLAYRGDTPAYVPVTSPDLVYPDNSFTASRWSDSCTFLRINDDWTRLRAWLEVPNLSVVVESRWLWDGVLEAETRQLQERYERTMSYFLTLVRQTQPASYQRILARLKRLRLAVVRNLTVEEANVRLPESPVVTRHEKAYLEKVDEPNPRGVGVARAGNLVVAVEATNNLDLLGEYVADYIDIARLADAFSLLMDRDRDPDQRHHRKMQFLESKNLSEADLKHVLADIKSIPDEDQLSSDAQEAIDLALGKLIGNAPSLVIPQPATGYAGVQTNGQVPDHEPVEQENGSDKEDRDGISLPEFPPLRFDQLPEVVFAVPGQFDTDVGHRRGGRGSGGGGGVPPEGVTRALGRRGEEWAFECEKQRLAKLQLNVADLERKDDLRWVSRELPTANHDIRSVDIDERGVLRTVFIEVKATSGDRPVIKMSRAEIELAFAQGPNYWLYWVANADLECPGPPLCYRDLPRLISEKRVQLNVDSLSLTLQTGSEQVT